jgi:hypothetical protein
MRSLALAQSDAAYRKLPLEKQMAIRDCLRAVVDELTQDQAAKTTPQEADGQL